MIHDYRSCPERLSSRTGWDRLRRSGWVRFRRSFPRVSNKASHNYAEIFDGVPSQHNGKDAAVVAELAGLGKAQPWEY